MFSIIKKIEKFFTHRGIVLMYHRVANEEFDPWELCVTPANFEQQLDVLKRKFRVTKAADLLNHLSNRSIRDKSVCITFDDGYRDNYTKARPLLENTSCPATFFIASDFVGT